MNQTKTIIKSNEERKLTGTLFEYLFLSQLTDCVTITGDCTDPKQDQIPVLLVSP